MSKEYDLKTKWYKPKSKINLEKIENLKKRLKEDHSLSELMILKIDLDTDLEQSKGFAPVVSTFAVVVTIMSLVINNSTNSSNRLNDQLDNLTEKLNNIQFESLPTEEKIVKFSDYALGQIDSLSLISLKATLNSIFMGIMALCLVIMGLYYYDSMKTTALLSSIVSRSYDEKEKEEEQEKELNKKVELNKERYELNLNIKKGEEFERKRIRIYNNKGKY
ncbi:hypothetical protein [Paenibacillus silvae]|uniref:hypothetical protein n=1 Tax=Paenibacillus silvae TaxID=1325358 RepID=UPI0011B37050|nr:hypothetical protein [Paenibacillus silvae]